MMNISDAGLDLIVQFESIRLTAYRDPVGILTIGAGHTGPDVHEGLVISRPRALELLRQDTRSAQRQILHLVHRPLNQPQWDATTSFVFNTGSAPLVGTFGQMLNAGDLAGAAGQFGRWVKGKVHGQLVTLPGLVRRRAAEAKMFTSAPATAHALTPFLTRLEREWVTRYDQLVDAGKQNSPEARDLHEKMRLQRKKIWRLAQPKAKGGDGNGWDFRHRLPRYRALLSRTT
jgi:lysozyme